MKLSEIKELLNAEVLMCEEMVDSIEIEKGYASDQSKYQANNSTFKPEANMTRAEVVTVINRMLMRKVAIEDIPNWAPSYTDLTEAHWSYADMIESSCGHDFERKFPGEADLSEIWTKMLDFVPVLES